MDNVKLTNFERIVIKGAEEKCNAILAEVNKQKKNAINDIKKELQAKAENRIKNETLKILKNKNERIARMQHQNKLDLLNYREGMIDEIFNSVTEKLIAFTDKDEYIEYMKSIIEKAKKELSSDISVILSKSDNDIAGKITDNAIISENNFIGGCIIVDKGNNLQIDQTFSTAINKAREEFLEKSNIII